MPEPRFPGFDVLSQARYWDRETTAVVVARTGPQPPLRFFTPAEEATARALLDQLLDHPDVPLLPAIDARLAELETDGWHYADMPMDDEAWRRSLHALDEEADGPFAALSEVQQRALIGRVQELTGEHWHGMPAKHVWSLWTRYACTAYYSHPTAWNEIGFGGPAHPRGYLRLGTDQREPWEVADAHSSP
ncbi:gluconate 2-dehydrogenase subunit 3 family protein, partial [Kitasatospora aureofaciens]